MPKGLEIPIGAPLDQLTKDLNGANTKVKQFEAQVNNSLSKAGTVAGKSTKDFTNLSRVIQDLPFGFIGISNNLTQLIPGVGALGLAFSALVAGLTFLQTGTDNWTRGLGNNKKAVDNLKLSGDEYSKTLTAIAQAQLKGTQDAQSELTNLSILYKTYTSNIASLETRKKAYDQLQSLYPAYFGNLKFEKDATDKTEGAYNKLTTAILATARARASADKIAENSSKQLENESKITAIEPQITQAVNDRITAQKKLDQARKLGQSAAGATLSLGLLLNAAENKENDIISIKRKLVTENNRLLISNLNLQKNINSQIAKGANLTGGNGGKATPAPKVTPITHEVLAPLKAIQSEIQFTQTAFQNLATVEQQSTQQAVQTVLSPLQEFNNYVGTTIFPQLQSGFESFFNNILENGKFSFSALKDSILQSFASVLASETTRSLLSLLNPAQTQLQKDKGGGLFGAVGGLFKKGGGGAGLLGSILPVAGIALGVGSILGSIFKGKKSADVPQPAYSNFSSSSINSPSISGGTVVFEISGVNLIGVLNRAGAKLVRYGG